MAQRSLEGCPPDCWSCKCCTRRTILWLIGVDEEGGVTGADYTELSTWFSSVTSYFDQLSPRMYDVNVPTDEGVTVVALLFETNRAPFVVRNQQFGQPNSGPIEREVTWREGTSTRSATRADLLSVLLDPGLLTAVLREMRWNLEVAKRQGFSQQQYRTAALERLFGDQLMATLDTNLQTVMSDSYRAISHAQSLVRSLEQADVRSRIDIGNESIRARTEAYPLIDRAVRALEELID